MLVTLKGTPILQKQSPDAKPSETDRHPTRKIVRNIVGGGGGEVAEIWTIKQSNERKTQILEILGQVSHKNSSWNKKGSGESKENGYSWNDHIH